ncbi:MAG: hypothetical protein NTW25_15685 [Candidatus Kapabacteria bacterium]|nr:hypothetical protein [Candidatus Kapabacteria bacterium]
MNLILKIFKKLDKIIGRWNNIQKMIFCLGVFLVIISLVFVPIYDGDKIIYIVFTEAYTAPRYIQFDHQRAILLIEIIFIPFLMYVFKDRNNKSEELDF